MNILIKDANKELVKVIKSVVKIANAKCKVTKAPNELKSEAKAKIIKKYEQEHKDGLTKHYENFEEFERAINAKI